MEDKEKELAVLKDRNGKLQQANFTLTFGLTLEEDQLLTKKEKDVFVVCQEIICFEGRAFGRIIQMIALNKPLKEYCMSVTFVTR